MREDRRTKTAGLEWGRLGEVDRGRHGQDGEIERLERWSDKNRGREIEVQETAGGEAKSLFN